MAVLYQKFLKTESPGTPGFLAVLVFMPLRLHALIIFMLGHFFAAFFLDGSHFFLLELFRL